MNIDNKLDLLKQIKQVEAPPYLLTRIRQQAQNIVNTQAPANWKWAFTVTAALVLTLNTFLYFKITSNKNKTENITHKVELEQVINTMTLSTNNELYHE